MVAFILEITYLVNIHKPHTGTVRICDLYGPCPVMVTESPLKEHASPIRRVSVCRIVVRLRQPDVTRVETFVDGTEPVIVRSVKKTFCKFFVIFVLDYDRLVFFRNLLDCPVIPESRIITYNPILHALRIKVVRVVE